MRQSVDTGACRAGHEPRNVYSDLGADAVTLAEGNKRGASSRVLLRPRGVTDPRATWSVTQWLIKFLEHRIGDARIIGLISKWLKAGTLEEGKLMTSEEGTPQGAVISPLLANIYLHHVFDLWPHQMAEAPCSGQRSDRALRRRHRGRRGQGVLCPMLRAGDAIEIGAVQADVASRKDQVIRFGRFAAVS